MLQSSTKYYSILQSTTPRNKILHAATLPYWKVFFRTTRSYTACCKVVLRFTYYSVLQSMTHRNKILQSTALRYKILNTPPYYKFDSRNTCETSFTVREATSGMQDTLELRHSRLMVATWKLIYSARSNLCGANHSGATTFKFDSRNTWYSAQGSTGHPRTPATYCACIMKSDTPKQEKKRFNVNYNTVRGRSEHDPNMNPSVRNPPHTEVTFRADHEHYVIPSKCLGSLENGSQATCLSDTVPTQLSSGCWSGLVFGLPVWCFGCWYHFWEVYRGFRNSMGTLLEVSSSFPKISLRNFSIPSSDKNLVGKSTTDVGGAQLHLLWLGTPAVCLSS